MDPQARAGQKELLSAEVKGREKRKLEKKTQTGFFPGIQDFVRIQPIRTAVAEFI